jgi:hypothetical protein
VQPPWRFTALSTRARLAGLRRALPKILESLDNVPVIGVTRCSRLDDYLASIRRSGARARVLEVSRARGLSSGGRRRPSDRRRGRGPGILR